MAFISKSNHRTSLPAPKDSFPDEHTTIGYHKSPIQLKNQLRPHAHYWLKYFHSLALHFPVVTQ